MQPMAVEKSPPLCALSSADVVTSDSHVPWEYTAWPWHPWWVSPWELEAVLGTEGDMGTGRLGTACRETWQLARRRALC